MAEEPKERKAFEAHMRVGGYSNPDKHPDGSYVSSAMELWWQGWKAHAQLPSQGGEAVAVVAWQDAENPLYTTAERRVMHDWAGNGYPIVELMTVAQHQRILAASVGSAKPVAWREHSVNYAKGEKCPETIETLQAAWDRDQELINDMRHEIASHKTRINRLEQRRPADQVADDLTMVKVPRELLEQIAVELEHDNDRYLLGRELRALLANSEGVKP